MNEFLLQHVMIYIPLIYFLILTILFYVSQKKIDVPVFLSAQFALTSFFAVVIVHMGLLDGGGVQFTASSIHLGVMPTLLYCVLHTLAILPFTSLKPAKITEITISSEKVFNLFAYFLMSIALLNLYIVLDNVIQVITGGDFATVRSAHYDGEETMAQQKAKRLPSILGYIYYFNRTTILALPCFFYSLCFLKRHWLFNVALFFTALSIPLAGIVGADRTEFIFFLQTCCVSFLLFRPFIGHTQIRFLKRLLIPIFSVMLLYLCVVTISRWDNTDKGASGAAIQYAGQSYLNFCFIYDNMHEGYIHIERILPLTYKIVHDDVDYSAIKEKKCREHGFFVGIFASYLGDFLLDVGMYGMLIWIACFVLLCIMTLPRSSPAISFGQVIWYYMLATIPMFGIFYYPYFTWLQVVCIIICAVMSILFHYNFVYKSKS